MKENEEVIIQGYIRLAIIGIMRRLAFVDYSAMSSEYIADNVWSIVLEEILSRKLQVIGPSVGPEIYRRVMNCMNWRIPGDPA